MTPKQDIPSQPVSATDACELMLRLQHYFRTHGEAQAGRIIPHPDPVLNAMLGGASSDRPVLSPDGSAFRKAAVLIPMQKPHRSARGQSGSQILFTVRTDTLSRHAGQVSFPGGRCDPDDSGPVMTALRESEEEIGLDPDSVEIIGQLSDIFLPSGYQVTPVVGLFEAGQKLRPSPHEVAEVFMTPADLVLTPSNYQRNTHRYQDSEHQILELQFMKHRIWGATANILFHLGQELEQLS